MVSSHTGKNFPLNSSSWVPRSNFNTSGWREYAAQIQLLSRITDNIQPTFSNNLIEFMSTHLMFTTALLLSPHLTDKEPEGNWFAKGHPASEGQNCNVNWGSLVENNHFIPVLSTLHSSNSFAKPTETPRPLCYSFIIFKKKKEKKNLVERKSLDQHGEEKSWFGWSHHLYPATIPKAAQPLLPSLRHSGKLVSIGNATPIWLTLVSLARSH